ncbi:hypothetical protein PAXINDRAFT_92447, partial [Paxillus involutus ATCC 200175]
VSSCEPIASQIILPYINQLVSELDITGGDSRKVGEYRIAAIESQFFVTQALTVLQWSRVSDHVGHKPVLLLGTFGLGLSMLRVCFGLSRTCWSLILRSGLREHLIQPNADNAFHDQPVCHRVTE